MFFPLFIARRIYRNDTPEGGRVSKPAITIALTGIVIGMAIMILSIAIALGFKQKVKEKAVATIFTKHAPSSETTVSKKSYAKHHLASAMYNATRTNLAC